MILVTGANGMVGSYAKGVFGGDRVYLTDVDDMDVRDDKVVEKKVKELKPDVVLHLAAMTDVDRCQQYPDEAFKTNILGTENIARACKKHNILMIYISTAGVFDGKKREPYTEFDTPGPVNIYGLSKLEGEKIVERLLSRYFIVRAGWMMGGGDKDKKFISKIVQLITTKDTIEVTYDKVGSLTFAKYLLMGIKDLLNNDRYGLYHMVCKGVCSRYEIAMEIVKILGKKVKVNSVSSAFFPLPAPRAYSEAMCNYKLDLLGINSMPQWQDALKEYLYDWLKLKE